jgi:prepilin-type N-terminal cleavage/methylation domain-containing protein
MVTRRAEAGFTAAEILVVITIVGILAAIAIPSLANLLQTQAVRSASYDLTADLTYARSEAISRGVNVSVVGASTTDYKAGWSITESGGNTTLRSQGSRDSKITFVSNMGTVTFDRTGRVTSGSAQWEIKPVDNAQDYQKRCIKLDPSGRPRTNEGVCS